MMLCGGGRAGGRQLLRPETLEQMFQSQAPQDRLSYGLGFVTGKFREHDTVGHMGAVYGFTSSLLVVPKHKLGVVVLANDDVIAGTVTKLAEAALELLLQIKTGEPPREEEKTVRLPIDQLAAYAGDYESESYWARIEIRGQRLWANVSGQEFEVTPAGGDRFWGDGRNAARVAWNFERDAVGAVQGFTALFQHFARVDPAAAAEIPAAWNDFLGCYGPKFIPLVISVKHGHLYAMTENMFDYRLTPLNRTSFHLPMECTSASSWFSIAARTAAFTRRHWRTWFSRGSTRIRHTACARYRENPDCDDSTRRHHCFGRGHLYIFRGAVRRGRERDRSLRSGLAQQRLSRR